MSVRSIVCPLADFNFVSAMFFLPKAVELTNAFTIIHRERFLFGTQNNQIRNKMGAKGTMILGKISKTCGRIIATSPNTLTGTTTHGFKR